MTPFTTVKGIAAPMPTENIDTDVIMPKQFLKRIDRKGLAEGAFHDLRFDAQKTLRPSFVLNRAPYDKASFLVCGANFGCGSSREYAVWGLVQLGIRAIIAPSFGGIFFGNCEKNGLLAIMLPQEEVARLINLAEAPATAEFEIDLLVQSIRADTSEIHFEIGKARKDALLTGRDHISATLEFAGEIEAFEAAQRDHTAHFWSRTR